MGNHNDKKKGKLETVLATWRISELQRSPVQGNFDSAHLKEINRRIFQDFPAKGLDHVTPGEYRPPVSGITDWRKWRSLESVDAGSLTAYSRMNQDARKSLDKILERADPQALSKLEPEEFTRQLGELYSDLDYIHPFLDGNSRTLREFTRQLAEEAGYTLDWEHFNKGPAGRDMLCIARDIGINERALPNILLKDVKRDVMTTLEQFEGNRKLPDLLQDSVSRIKNADKTLSSQAKSENGKKVYFVPFPEACDPEKRVFTALKDATAHQKLVCMLNDLDRQAHPLFETAASNVDEKGVIIDMDNSVPVAEERAGSRVTEEKQDITQRDRRDDELER